MTQATRRFAHRMTAAFALGVLLTALTGIASILTVRALAPAHNGERHLIDAVAGAAIVAYALIALVMGRRFVRQFEEAQAAIAGRERFIEGTTRELGRPLASLEQELARLRPLSPTSPEIDRALAGSDVALGRLHELLAELSEATRLSTGEAKLAREPVDLAEIVRQVGARVVRRYGPAVPIDLEAAEHVVGEWDRARLEEVVWHLVSNALKFGHGRRIRVRVTGGEVARLVVQDHGVGISPEQQARLFEAFRRSGRTRGGLGLGLYIVRSVVAAHGGTVRVESVPGVGSKFTVELPTKPPAGARERVPRMPFVRPQQA